jgi:superfamily II DNA or RNA helicase
MSLCVPLYEIQDSIKKHIYRKLKVKEKADMRSKTAMFRTLKEIAPYRINEEKDTIFLPFQWAYSQVFFKPYRPPRNVYGTLATHFTGELRPEQKIIQTEAIQYLNQQGSILLACYPGFGKTITTLSISSKIGLKTLILVNRVILIDQWVSSIQNFFQHDPKPSIQVLNATNELNRDADFYIMNAINTVKRPDTDFQKIGLLIVDECHLMITSVFIKALGCICPRYLIGLSATPFRPDGLDVLLDIYFGKERIVREMYRRHVVYKVNTNIEIQGEQDDKGMLIWNSVLQKQMTNTSRNTFIRDVCLFFKTRNILILCKRIQQVEDLYGLISDHTLTCTLKGNENEFNTECRVLIATVAKVGVGFSFDKLDMLILACDLKEYYLQFVGRVFRKPDVVPIIIDIVDKNPVLYRHFKSRLKVYQDCGGTLYDFRSMFPDFSLSFE